MATRSRGMRTENDDIGDAHRTPVTPEEDARTVLINQISWGAVFAGVVVALATHIILNLLGVGVGAATLDPGTGDNPDAEVFSAAAALWWTVSGILASLLGGYVAGRSAGKPKESTGGYHGIASWATTTLVIFFMLTSSLGAVVGGFAGSMGQDMGMEGPGAEGQSPMMDQLKDQLGKMTGQDQAQNQGQPPAQNQNPAEGAPPAQADAETAETAANAVSIGSIFAALALLAGAFAAWVGGCMGAVDPTLTDAARRRI